MKNLKWLLVTGLVLMTMMFGTIVSAQEPVESSFTGVGLVVEPAFVEEGDPVSVKAELKNDTDAFVSEGLVLYFGGLAVETRKVELEAGAATTVTFTAQGFPAGSYDVAVGGMKVQISVSAEVVPEATPAEDPAGEPPEFPVGPSTRIYQINPDITRQRNGLIQAFIHLPRSGYPIEVDLGLKVPNGVFIEASGDGVSEVFGGVARMLVDVLPGETKGITVDIQSNRPPGSIHRLDFIGSYTLKGDETKREFPISIHSSVTVKEPTAPERLGFTEPTPTPAPTPVVAPTQAPVPTVVLIPPPETTTPGSTSNISEPQPPEAKWWDSLTVKLLTIVGGFVGIAVATRTVIHLRDN